MIDGNQESCYQVYTFSAKNEGRVKIWKCQKMIRKRERGTGRGEERGLGKETVGPGRGGRARRVEGGGRGGGRKERGKERVGAGAKGGKKEGGAVAGGGEGARKREGGGRGEGRKRARKTEGAG